MFLIFIQRIINKKAQTCDNKNAQIQTYHKRTLCGKKNFLHAKNFQATFVCAIHMNVDLWYLDFFNILILMKYTNRYIQTHSICLLTSCGNLKRKLGVNIGWIMPHDWILDEYWIEYWIDELCPMIEYLMNIGLMNWWIMP